MFDTCYSAPMEQPLIDIIAVHGLWDHKTSLWTYADELSIREKLSQKYPRHRFLMYNQDKVLSEAVSEDDLNDAGDRLLKEIHTWRLTEYRQDIVSTGSDATIRDGGFSPPLLFVAFGLGGLVVKSALLLARSRSRLSPVAWRTFGIVFLGTPHGSSESRSSFTEPLTQFVPLASEVWQPSNRVTEEFQPYAGLYSIAYFCGEDYHDHMSGGEMLHSDCLWSDISQAHTFDIAEHHYMAPRTLASSKLWEYVQRSIDCMGQAATRRERRHIAILETQRLNRQLCEQERAPGTCDWLLEHQGFQNWVSFSDGDCLWIQGCPGVGKTLLSSMVSPIIFEEPATPVTTLWFLRYMNEDLDRVSSPAVGFLNSLIAQLKDSPRLLTSDILLQPILADIEKADTCMSEGQFESHLRMIFTNLDASVTVVLVIDHVSWITSTLLQQAVQANSSRDRKHHIRCSISSRGPPCFTESLQRHISVINLDEEPSVKSDISRWVRTQLMSNYGALGGPEPDLLDALTAGICARNNFLTAKLTIRYLRSTTSVTELRSRVDSLPVNLTDIYQEMLHSIEPHDQVKTQVVLSWITAATRPLTMMELLEALEWSRTPSFAARNNLLFTEETPHLRESDILRWCGGFIVIAADSTLRFVHSTAYEFITNTEIGDPSHDPAIRSHDLIARACLGHLTRTKSKAMFLRCNGCRHGEVASKRPMAKEARHEIKECETSEKVYSLEEYAATNWKYHYRIAEPHSRTLAGTLQHALSTCLHDLCRHAKVPREDLYIEVAHTIFKFATSHGFNSLVQMLLESGANSYESNCTWCMTPLTIASVNNRVETLLLLLQRGPSPDIRLPDSATLLQLAIEHNDIDIVQLLLLNISQSKSTLSQVTLSSLAAAIMSGNLEILKLVMEHGDNNYSRQGFPDLVSETGQTALHLAVKSKSVCMVKYIVGCGGISTESLTMCQSVLRKTYFQSWAREVMHDLSGSKHFVWEMEAKAVAKEDLRVLFNISQRYSDLDARDGKGRTPLHYAALYGQEDIVQYLLLRGASFIVEDNWHYSPLQLAAENGHLNTVKWLLATGAPAYPRNGCLSSFLQRVLGRGHETVANLLLLDFYVRNTTDGTCSWKMLNVISKIEQSPIRKALVENRSSDKRARRTSGV